MPVSPQDWQLSFPRPLPIEMVARRQPLPPVGVEEGEQRASEAAVMAGGTNWASSFCSWPQQRQVEVTTYHG